MSIAHDKQKYPRSIGAQCVDFILKHAYLRQLSGGDFSPRAMNRTN